MQALREGCGVWDLLNFHLRPKPAPLGYEQLRRAGVQRVAARNEQGEAKRVLWAARNPGDITRPACLGEDLARLLQLERRTLRLSAEPQTGCKQAGIHKPQTPRQCANEGIPVRGQRQRLTAALMLQNFMAGVP